MSRLLWPELGEDDAAAGWLPEPGAGYKAADVIGALERKHADFGGADWKTPAAWAVVREVQERTGVYGDAQRFDVVAIGLVPSVKYARIIYEVKVSRADWLRELKLVVDVIHRTGHKLSSHLAHRVNSDELIAAGYTVNHRTKWASALALSTEFYFAAPPRCILPSEVPEGCGLVEVRPWGAEREMRCRVVVKAPVRDTPNPGPEFWAAVVRRAATHR